MTRQRKNKIRGLILLLVFSLNSVAGFACSIGVDMGYNKKHHQHDGSNTVSKSHTHTEKHQHEHSPASLSNDKIVSIPDSKADCCTNGVTDFIKLDKSVANSTDLQPPVFLVAFISQFLLPAEELSLPDTSLYGSLRRSWLPTDDTDLRIVIQSFQI
jgi:hypothetical protein